jgi:hypothetical protein
MDIHQCKKSVEWPTQLQKFITVWPKGILSYKEVTKERDDLDKTNNGD